MSLIDTWLEAGQAAGCSSKSEVIRVMNDDLGTNYAFSRVYEWAKGVYRPPLEVSNYMLAKVLGYAIKQVKPKTRLSVADLKHITDMLALPEKGE